MPPPPPRPAAANFPALRHYSHTPLPSTTATTPPASLTTEIHSLRRLIMDQELALSTLRQQQHPAAPTPTPKPKLHTLKALKKAHDTAFATIDYLPPADSPLNLLLAYRSVLLVAARTDTSLGAVKGAIAAASATLEREGVELAAQRALAGALAGRVARLEGEAGGEEGGEEGGAGVGGVAEVVKRRREVGRRAAGVLRELRGFVGGVLAGMLLCEERGGGVVGDVVVGGEGGGEEGRGKGKRGGERRIDEMWGQDGEEEEEEPEKRVAREFMELLEALMNAALENDPYIPTPHDTAIVRFLVRAKVAAFHPKDARRLRLVDFGSSVEDV